MIGKTIGHYKITEEIGQGGMGTVFKAQDVQLDRTVVMKVLSGDLLGIENACRRFLREARLASALDHPNICMIYEIQESDGYYFIIMQYVEGDNLKKIINNRPLAVSTFISIALQSADALATAHDHGIIHRDIKPQNIMITPRGQAKVLDFGLAKMLDEGGEIRSPKESKPIYVANYEEGTAHRRPEDDLTEGGETPGTPAYMSPEQAKQERIDKRSDIFSFGTVLYEMATGQKAFVGRDNQEIVRAVCNLTPKPISAFNPDAPPGLQEIIDRAMAKNPAKRHQSMQALMADLKLLSSAIAYGQAVPDGIQKPFAPIERVQSSWMDRLLPKSMRRKVSPTDATQPSLPTLSLPSLPSDDFPVIPGHNKTLAILPFRNLSDRTDKTLSLQLLEDLIGHLAEFKSVTVRPSSYVMKYLEKEVNPVDVGHSLGVDAVLVGSLLGSETKLRVMAQMIEADSGSIIWSGTIDASDSNMLRLLDSISERLISQISGKQHTSSPYDMLGDENEEVRLNAISTLKYSFEPQAMEALADALSDKSVRVKTAAAEALRRFERLAAPAVTARLEEALHRKDFDTARFAAKAAGLLGIEETVPTLLETLACEDSMTASEAALALGRLRDIRAQHELIEALARSDASVRFTSAQALGEIGDPKSLDALAKRMLEDTDEGVRAKAFWAIKHIQKSIK